jgi:hypothetical protein
MEKTHNQATPPPFEAPAAAEAPAAVGPAAGTESGSAGQAEAPDGGADVPAETEVGMYQSEAIEAAAQAGEPDAGDYPFFLANLRPGFWD